MQGRYEQFSFIVSVINRQIQKIERDEMIKFGHKGAFAQYLMIMRHHPDGITASQLSELCDKDKAAVSRVLAEMTEKGLVLRKTENDTAYRAKLVLTEEGHRIAEIVSQRGMQAVDAVGNELSNEERKNFYSTLDYIASKLQLISKEGIPQE
ncbi:MAG: MarR family transcriptional regulator [Oscillospiraceae bacterium]|nr:MarR family transcriptional regulator [Oscillospiraceae bacterium]